MRTCGPWMAFIFAGCWPVAVGAQLQILPDREPQCVFAEDARKINVIWYNDGDQAARTEIHTRLSQTSSATAVPLAEKPWKTIEMLPGQTVLETAQLDFPTVRGETRFLIQWLDGTNRVLGKTEVLAYPTNLLGQLKTLMGENVLGALDPDNELKPLLRQNRVDFVDLDEASLGDFHGKLAIIGPFQSKLQMREGLAQTIRRIARKGAAVVWIQPTPAPNDNITPSFYLVPEGKGVVVIVQSELVAKSAENPRSQLNLIRCSKLALTPEPFLLPDLKAQP